MAFLVFIVVFLAILGILREEIPIIFNLVVFIIVCFLMMLASGILRVVYECIKPIFE